MSEARKRNNKRAKGAFLERSAWALARQHPPKRVVRCSLSDLELAKTGLPKLAPLSKVNPISLSGLNKPSEFVLSLALEGLHVVAAKVGSDARIFDRELRPWAHAFERIARAVGAMEFDELVLEGVLVTLDDLGRPSFARLRELVSGSMKWPARLVVIDVRHVHGRDLSHMTLRERRDLAEQLVFRHRDTLAVCPTIDAAPERAIAAAAHVGAGAITLEHDVVPSSDACVFVAGMQEGEETPWLRSVSPPPVVTNPNKLLYPKDNLSKQQVARYYDEIAPVMLKYLHDRPVVSQRFVDGIAEFTWYQHRLPPRAPDYVRPVRIDNDRRIVLENRDALLWMVNQAAIVFHGWTSRVSSLESPDWAIIDLDPGEDTKWEETIEVATAVRRLLELVEVPSYPKTSGQKGIHVLVPMKSGQTPAHAHTFAAQVAAMLARLLPDTVTIESQKAARAGRLFVDVQQSFVGRQLVLPYSLRATDGAPVSAPLLWSEIVPQLDPRAFTLKTMLARLDRLGDPMHDVLVRGVDLAPAIARMLSAR